ncbi:MAG: GHMP kinase [Bacteroidetes bacterium MedPE-SWsnd-G1]|nr:MAG: GHMP kinase [Bacteroidetes bacterium MedPE-SWsnd-G1]
MKKYYSNGKLLLSAEYLVLDGAMALAIPTKYGQDLVVEPIKEPVLVWESYDVDKNCWFQAEFRLPELRIINETFDANSEDSKESIAQTLHRILLASREMNPKFLNETGGLLVKTNLSFPRDWGLGTSSTLINNIAQWADVDAFLLLQKSFGGSGYDIACAQNDSPITYQILNDNYKVVPLDFKPSFADKLFFVHLNQKQDSKKGIKRYRERNDLESTAFTLINEITEQMIHCEDLKKFEDLIVRHEELISEIIQNKPIKEIVFGDYFGAIKSLGAWGGDFVLATGNDSTPAYFKSKGFETVIPYNDMIL